MNRHLFLSEFWGMDLDEIPDERIPGAIKELKHDLRTLDSFYARGELMLEHLQKFVESEKLRPGQLKGLEEWNKAKARKQEARSE